MEKIHILGQRIKEAYLKIKKLFLFLLILYLLSFSLGYLLVSFEFKPALLIREKLISELPQLPPFKEILSLLTQKRLFLITLLTFGFNLIFGAFISTTLSGLIFFLPFIVTFERGLIVGLAYSGIFSHFSLSILALGTIFFEFLAYSLSGACGINLGLAIIRPSRYKTKKRFLALRKALVDSAYLYLIVALLLLLGALWEMGGLFLLK